MSSPLQFDHVEAAQRVRDAIKKISGREARIVAPPAIIARMTQVDITTRTGEAWIVGDREPVPVILPDGFYPGAWDNKDGRSQDRPAIEGAGSMVVLQSFGDQLYVTDVLTGGKLIYRPSMMGANIVTQSSENAELYRVGGNSHVDRPHEFFFAERLVSQSLGAGSAVNFGPFHGGFGYEYQPGRVELTVSSRWGSEDLGVKMYDFILNPQHLFRDEGLEPKASEQDKWFRLLPYADDPKGTLPDYAAAPVNDYTGHEFDIDIALRYSEYTRSTNLWFRYVQRDAHTSGIDIWITIRTTAFENDTPLYVKKQIVQEGVASPPPIKGYLGFHNNSHIFHDSNRSNTKTLFRGNQWGSGPWRPSYLRVAQDLQRTWDLTASDDFIWEGNNLRWTGSIRFSGVGIHRNGLAGGSAILTCPITGTIPIMGPVNSSATVSATLGIPLASYQALYCAVPPGVGNGDLQQYLFIVDDISLDYQLPEWAVLIASRPRGVGHVRLGNGQFLDWWHTVTLTGGWLAYDPATWNAPSFRKEAGGVVRLRGLVKSGTGSVFTLPSGYRPPKNAIFICPTGPSGSMARVDVGSDGTVNPNFFNAGGTNSWVSLEQITFATTP